MSEALVLAQNLTVKYPIHSESALNGLSLRVDHDEFVVLAGASGSGKSTFCRALIGLIPNLTKGDIVDGSLHVCGHDTRHASVHTLAQQVGMVFQDPETNIFSLNVLDELAFGPENVGLERAEISRRIEVVSEWVGIQPLLHRRTDQLSGGQKQRVAIAGVLAMQPRVLVLDEPTTDLDPAGKKQVVSTLVRLKSLLRATIIVIEHDLSHLLDVADRLIIMADSGRILLDGPPAHVLASGMELIMRQGIRVPTYCRVGTALGRLEPDSARRAIPLNYRQAWQMIAAAPDRAAQVAAKLDIVMPAEGQPSNTPPVLQVDELHAHYTSRQPVLRGISFSVQRGEFVAIIGPNGSGKSTLLKLLAGLCRPAAGSIRLRDASGQPVPEKHWSDHVSFVFQDPDHQLFANTVWDEVAFGLRARKASQTDIAARVTDLLQRVRLLGLKDRHPATLSRGERRRLAVATALSQPVDVLLLDEPTTGQDFRTLTGLFEILRQLSQDEGTTILFVTHDMCTVWQYAMRVVGIKDGRLLADGPTREVLRPGNEPLLDALECELPLEAALGHMLSGYCPSPAHAASAPHVNQEAS